VADLHEIYAVYRSLDENDCIKLSVLMSELYLTLSVKSKGEVAQYHKPSEVYEASSQMLLLYGNYENKWFASALLQEWIERDADFAQFAGRCLMNRSPIRKTGKWMTQPEVMEFVPNPPYLYGVEVNYTLDELESILGEMNLEKSQALWHVLRFADDDYFSAKVTWKKGKYHALIEPYFVKRLNEAKWLMDSDGKWHAPSDLMKRSLAAGYKEIEGTAIAKRIKFVPDWLDLLPPELSEKLKLVCDLSLADIRLMVDWLKRSRKD
jgi:hypothetical protein